MFNENALVIYKNKPAVIKDHSDGKYTILLSGNEQVKVRDKDIELLHPGPVKDFSFAGANNMFDPIVRDVWELLCDDESSQPLSLKELAVFIHNEYSPVSAYAVYLLLCDGLYFSGTIEAITPNSKNDVNAEELKRCEKQRDLDERMLFLERLRKCLKNPEAHPLFPSDSRFIQDIEALASGKSAKSRTMKDLGFGETPEEAHSLLLKTGFWTGLINPHPGRFGVTLNSASVCPQAPAEEDRICLCRLAAYAIDSPWSNDPDDAVSAEKNEAGNSVLYVHVADPASSITFGSPAEKEARNRGATIYLPEGAVRMLAEESIPMFALGLSEKSNALTVKMTFDDNGSIIDTDIFLSVIKVSRITYEQADAELDTCMNGNADAEKLSEAANTLNVLFELSQKIYNRRITNGAVNIELPEIHISVKNDKVNINPVKEYRSAFIVKECMIAAGEGAGTWAASRGLAFPYISQDVETQSVNLRIVKSGGFAKAMQLRRCMRPRLLSVKPGEHQGLGLDVYTQVTSPLRRYTDLLAHIQIRKFLCGSKPLSADEISMCLGFGEAAATAAVHAERASLNHWKMVFLADKKDSIWDAVAIENKGSRWHVLIPSLALETQTAIQGNIAPNDNVKLVLKSVNIAKGEAVFVQG